MGVLAFYWTLLIIATHWPTTVAALDEGSRDKVVHFLAYAILAWLLAWKWSPTAALGWRSAVGLWLLLAVVAALDELLQIPVGRSCEFYDWVADVAGASLGLWLYHLWSKWRHAKACSRGANSRPPSLTL